MIRTYKVRVDAKITGYIRCEEDDFTETVYDMIDEGDYEMEVGSIDWEYADREDV